MRALIVDDSRAMRLILGRFMVEAGFEVLEAEDGRDALQKLGSDQEFDLALVDWNMPNMNGIELVQAIRADPRLQNMQIMMVTTESEMQQIVRALEAGANEYVMKPFTKDVLVEKLDLLGLKQS